MGYAGGFVFIIILMVAFVPACVICYAVVLRKNAKRDVYHQIPILKSFLYALVWTPVILSFIFLIFGALDAWRRP